LKINKSELKKIIREAISELTPIKEGKLTETPGVFKKKTQTFMLFHINGELNRIKNQIIQVDKASKVKGLAKNEKNEFGKLLKDLKVDLKKMTTRKKDVENYKVEEGKLTEDFKNNKWEVYVADEKGKEKIVKVAKSKRAGVILYNKLINSDKYHEVGMRVIKEGKLTEAKMVKLILPVKDRKKVVHILQKQLKLKISKDFDYGGQKGSNFVIELDKKFEDKVLELFMKTRIKVRG